MLVAREAGSGLADSLTRLLRRRGSPRVPERPARRDIDQFVGSGAAHQGVAAAVDPLPAPDFERLCRTAGPGTVAVGLDRVTDPQNIGAVLRSAAAFGAAFLVLPARHAPGETGALAKAASGALETVPVVRVRRFAHTLASLREANFLCLGLDPDSPIPVAGALRRAGVRRPLALLLGAEGSGLQPRTRASCDALVSIPIQARTGSLNVSVAAAIALYEARGRHGNPPLPAARRSGPPEAA